MFLFKTHRSNYTLEQMDSEMSLMQGGLTHETYYRANPMNAFDVVCLVAQIDSQNKGIFMSVPIRNHEYFSNVWLVENEHATAQDFQEEKVHRLVDHIERTAVAHGKKVVDVSYRLNGMTHALHLMREWCTIVREARICKDYKDVLLLVRSVHNSGPRLMQQRLEMDKGHCAETSPLACVLLCGERQLLVLRDDLTRDDTMIAATTEFLSNTSKTAMDGDDYHDRERHEDSSLMPSALFSQQINALDAMIKALNVGHGHGKTSDSFESQCDRDNSKCVQKQQESSCLSDAEIAATLQYEEAVAYTNTHSRTSSLKDSVANASLRARNILSATASVKSTDVTVAADSSCSEEWYFAEEHTPKEQSECEDLESLD